RLTNPATKSPQAVLWADLQEVQVVDDYTVVIRTKNPIGPMLYNLALTAILPPGVADNPSFPQRPIGTGPFKVVQWLKGDRLILEANRDYWRGAPRLSRLIWREIPETATRMSALESGDVDIANNVPPEELARLNANPRLTTMSTPCYRSMFVWVNAGRPPFDNPKVRDAVRYAIDTEPLVTHIMGGHAVKANSPLSPGVFGATEFQPYPYDPERAKRLLAEAGYPGGFTVELKFREADVKNKEIAEAIAYQLDRVGIRVKPIQQDGALWVSDLLALRWDMVIAGTSSLTADADFTLRRVYHSSAKRTGYVNPELDRCLEEGQRSVDPKARATAYAEAQRILWDDGPAVWLFYSVSTYGVSKRVKGFIAPPDEMPRFYSIWVEG
ncbi:MAG: ABC transporter substrate-binding protein, partial [Bacillota bacterium]